MSLLEIIKILLMILLIACAISVNLVKSLRQSVIIFMSYSTVMCIVWILMESPDLAITEAAVGAGISGALFLLALRKIRETNADRKMNPPSDDPNASPREKDGEAKI